MNVSDVAVFVLTFVVTPLLMLAFMWRLARNKAPKKAAAAVVCCCSYPACLAQYFKILAIDATSPRGSERQSDRLGRSARMQMTADPLACAEQGHLRTGVSASAASAGATLWGTYCVRCFATLRAPTFQARVVEVGVRERIVHVWRSRASSSSVTRCGLDLSFWRWRALIGRVVYKRSAEPANVRRRQRSRWCARCVPTRAAR